MDDINSGNRMLGLLVIIISILANPYILAFFIDEDNSIAQIQVKIAIFIGEIVLMSIGILIYKSQESYFFKRRKEIFLLCITIILCFIMLEVVLRIYPVILGQTFVNSVLGRYNTREDGIYYYDPILNINFMKPDFTTTAYYNGYYWTHKTDALGFRNEENRQNGDIILLGDSYIYGHGVEFNQTVGYFIENMTGAKVINLARQGDTSYQELYLLNEYGFRYKPEYVIYFFFENDLIDLYVHNINKTYFLETPVDELYFLKTSPQTPVENLEESSVNFDKFIFTKRLYILRAVNMLMQKVAYTKIYSREYNDSEAWAYTKKAIYLMNNLSHEHNATFVIVPITPGNQTQFKELEKIALENNIMFIDSSVIQWSNTTLFLERDGHFSEEGAKLMATIVVDAIREHGENNE